MRFTADSSTQSSGIRQFGLLLPEPLRESLVGKMCQIIEMLGLKDSQEKAAKDSVKNAIYDMLGHDGSAELIDAELYEIILSVLWQERNYSQKHGVLTGSGDYCLTKTIPDASVEIALAEENK